MKNFKLYTPKRIDAYAFLMCMPDDNRSVKSRGNQPGDLDYFLDAMHRDFNDIGLSMPRDHGVVLYTGDLGPYVQPQDFDVRLKELFKKCHERYQHKPDIVFFVMPRRGAARTCIKIQNLTFFNFGIL